jgi:hypothetical protein
MRGGVMPLDEEDQQDLSPVDPTEDDDDVVNDGRCGDATPGEVALGEKAERFAPETGGDFIPLDPVEDDEAVPGEEENGRFEEDCMVYGQCGGVTLDEVALHGQFASEVEDFLLPLDPTEDDDIAYGREWLHLFNPFCGPSYYPS